MNEEALQQKIDDLKDEYLATLKQEGFRASHGLFVKYLYFLALAEIGIPPEKYPRFFEKKAK